MNPARPLGAASLPQADFQGLDGAALEALRGARLFITGGTGFIGAWLLEYLYRQDRDRHLGLELLLLSRAPARFLAAHPHYAAWPALAMVEGDVRRLDGLDLEADALLHGATPASAALNAASPLEMIAKAGLWSRVAIPVPVATETNVSDDSTFVRPPVTVRSACFLIAHS